MHTMVMIKPTTKKKPVVQQTAFKKYLESEEIGSIRAAEQLGITQSYVNGLSSGTQTPGLKLAIKIELWSKGAVPVTSWRKK